MFIKRSTSIYQSAQVNSSVNRCSVCGKVIIDNVKLEDVSVKNVCSECESQELRNAEADSQQHIH